MIKTMTRVLAAGSLLMAVGSLVLAVPAGAGPIPEPCVPPLHQTSPGAQCTFDIWGIVTDDAGHPYSGVAVTDGNEGVYTDANGYYDLYESGPSGYTVTADASPPLRCEGQANVDESLVSGIQNGGARQDFQLPCAPSGG